MGEYSIDDFKVGDKVYHLSNHSIEMVVFEINKDLNEISCRWIDNKGKLESNVFKSQELGKENDWYSGIDFGSFG